MGQRTLNVDRGGGGLQGVGRLSSPVGAQQPAQTRVVPQLPNVSAGGSTGPGAGVGSAIGESINALASQIGAAEEQRAKEEERIADSAKMSRMEIQRDTAVADALRDHPRDAEAAATLYAESVENIFPPEHKFHELGNVNLIEGLAILEMNVEDNLDRFGREESLKLLAVRQQDQEQDIEQLLRVGSVEAAEDIALEIRSRLKDAREDGLMSEVATEEFNIRFEAAKEKGVIEHRTGEIADGYLSDPDGSSLEFRRYLQNLFQQEGVSDAQINAAHQYWATLTGVANEAMQQKTEELDQASATAAADNESFESFYDANGLQPLLDAGWINQSDVDGYRRRWGSISETERQIQQAEIALGNTLIHSGAPLINQKGMAEAVDRRIADAGSPQEALSIVRQVTDRGFMPASVKNTLTAAAQTTDINSAPALVEAINLYINVGEGAMAALPPKTRAFYVNRIDDVDAGIPVEASVQTYLENAQGGQLAADRKVFATAARKAIPTFFSEGSISKFADNPVLFKAMAEYAGHLIDTSSQQGIATDELTWLKGHKDELENWAGLVFTKTHSKRFERNSLERDWEHDSPVLRDGAVEAVQAQLAVPGGGYLKMLAQRGYLPEDVLGNQGALDYIRKNIVSYPSDDITATPSQGSAPTWLVEVRMPNGLTVPLPSPTGDVFQGLRYNPYESQAMTAHTVEQTLPQEQQLAALRGKQSDREQQVRNARSTLRQSLSTAAKLTFGVPTATTPQGVTDSAAIFGPILSDVLDWYDHGSISAALQQALSGVTDFDAAMIQRSNEATGAGNKAISDAIDDFTILLAGEGDNGNS